MSKTTKIHYKNYEKDRFADRLRKIHRKLIRLKDDGRITVEEFYDNESIPNKYRDSLKLLRRAVISLTGLVLLVSCSEFDENVENYENFQVCSEIYYFRQIEYQRQIYLNDNYVASDFYADN